MNKSFASTAQKNLPPKPIAKTQGRPSKTPAMTPKAPVTVTSTKTPPKPPTKTVPEKTQTSVKRGSVAKPLPSKSPVKSPNSTTKVIPKAPGKSVAVEKTSSPGVPKPPVSEGKVIEVHQKVVKVGSVVTSSTTFVRKETEPSNNLPLKSSMGESKVGIRRNTLGQEEIGRNMPNVDEEKRNSSFYSIDISAISNAERRPQRYGKVLQEGSIERQDYDTHQLLKNLEDFEKKFDFTQRNRFQSMSMAPQPLEEAGSNFNKELKLPMLTDHSLKNILKLSTVHDVNNNSSFDDQMQNDMITPVNKNGKYTYDVEMRFTTQENIKNADKDMIDQSSNGDSSNGFRNRDAYLPGLIGSNKKNTTSIGMLLQPNHEVKTEALTDQNDHASLATHYPKNLSTFSNGSYRIVRETLDELIKRVLNYMDDAMVKFQSHESNAEEMSQLLAKYTDTSFHQVYNKIYTHANLSSENLNTSFRKNSVNPTRENLERSFHKPLTSTTLLFDNMHFNCLNNFADTRLNHFADSRTNFEDTRLNLTETKMNLLLKTFKSQNEESISPIPKDEPENARALFAPELKPREPEDKRYEKFHSFTNSDNVFLNNDNVQKTSPMRKSDDSPTFQANGDKERISNGIRVLPMNPVEHNDRPISDIESVFAFRRQSECSDQGRMYYQDSPSPNFKLLNNISEDSERQIKSQINFVRVSCGLFEENVFSPNLSQGESVINKQTSWAHRFNSNGDGNVVNQELDKSFKGSQYEEAKQATLNNIKNENFGIQKTNTLDDERVNSPVPTMRQSQQISEDLSSSLLIRKMHRINYSSASLSNQSDSNVTQSGVRKSNKLQILDLTNEFSRMNSKSDLIYKLTLLFKKMLVYSSKLEAIKSELFNNNPDFNILEIFQLYDENKAGTIAAEEFEAFLADVGIQVSGQQTLKILEYVNNIVWPEGQDIRIISSFQFANIFIPYNTDNRFILKQMLEMKQKKLEAQDSANEQPIIQESDFLLIRQILIFMMRKVEDISAIVQSLKEYSVDEAFGAITKGEKNDINWKTLSEFLEQNDVRFIDEDLVYIFRDFKSRSMGVIGYQNFSEFINLGLWLI